MYCRELLSTAELVPVVTHQGFFRIGDFYAKRATMPQGGFKKGVIHPGTGGAVDWTVLEAILMTVYSVGGIVTGEPPQLLVSHLSHETTGWTSCFAVTPLLKPYACQAAWAAAVMGHTSLGKKIFDDLAETMRKQHVCRGKGGGGAGHPGFRCKGGGLDHRIDGV